MSEKHYYEQVNHTREYLIPYFKDHITDFQSKNVLEVGCAEGGFIQVLNEENINVCGFELEEGRVKMALEKNPELNIVVGDITDSNLIKKYSEQFDLIVIRDVIEHVPDRNSTFRNLNKLLKKDGYLYITFPPRFSAYAGHQQVGKSVLRFIPYVHYLPSFLLKQLGKIFKEREQTVEHILENYRIGLSIREFTKYYKLYLFKPVIKGLFLLRPVFKIRFNTKVIKFFNIIFFREFFALGCEYLLIKIDDID
jgi:2-polyprenyl-3-methyl-5-hydroxy-6-metoxy-1,4-benzoquinol methylase